MRSTARTALASLAETVRTVAANATGYRGRERRNVMSFRLKEAVFKVRCREPGCSFVSDFAVKENIMGATEADVDSEALKIARNLGFIKHDAILGRKHQLANPEVYKISGSYEHIGPGPAVPAAPAAAPVGAPPAASAGSAPVRTYRKGEVIIRKGDSATMVCEVLRGSAHNEKLPDLLYRAGATFGAAAIFKQKDRMADIVAGEDSTTVAFYNLRELARNNPAKARALYDEAMEDVFHILRYYEQYAASLEGKLKRLQAAKPAPKKAPGKAARKAPAKKAVKKAAAKAAKKAAAKKRPAPKKAANKPAARKAAKKSRKR
jgi:CRP-like cAMP-binding protein